MGTAEETYTWKPSSIKNAHNLCEKKDDCGNINKQYNVSNVLLSWSKDRMNARTIIYNFT